jgi:hypothetical protein
MYKYKVLWLDDEHDSLNLIHEKAHLNDIDLIGFSNASDGLEELERNINRYDAAVIDGIFFLHSDQTGTPSSDAAISAVAKALTRLEVSKKLPWFILSGQSTFTKEKNRIADAYKDNEVYDKLDDDDLSQLWEDIKREADRQIETQIRLKYQSVFEVCSAKYIGEELAQSLLNLLESVEQYNERRNTEDKLNALRKLMEKCFGVLNRMGVLPDAVWKSQGSINNSSRFLWGKHSMYNYHEQIVPPCIGFLVGNILHVTQDGSHADGDLNLRVDAFIKSQPTGYFFNSVVFQLLEVMVWLKKYVDARTDVDKNKLMATLKPSLKQGTIEQDKFNNYHCEDNIITYKHFNDNRYAVGDTIIILKTGENTNEKTRHLYSGVIVASEKI